MDCSLPGSSIREILQARILEWVSISFSRGFSWTRDRTQVSCIAGRCFNLWPTRESYGFSSSHVQMWELDYKESWAPKNWCFWTVVLEKALESPLDWRRSNQSILKEIKSEYSLEGLLLKLKLQYFGHLIQRENSLEKNLMLGKIEGKREEGSRECDGQIASLTQCTWIWANSKKKWRTEEPVVLQSLGGKESDET